MLPVWHVTLFLTSPPNDRVRGHRGFPGSAEEEPEAWARGRCMGSGVGVSACPGPELPVSVGGPYHVCVSSCL